MNAHTHPHRDPGFAIGLLTGTFVGAGLAMWLVPRSASELRRRMTDSARNLGKRVSDQYEQASIRLDEAVDELARRGQAVRDVANAVGGHEVERKPTAGRRDRIPEAKTP